MSGCGVEAGTRRVDRSCDFVTALTIVLKAPSTYLKQSVIKKIRYETLVYESSRQTLPGRPRLNFTMPKVIGYTPAWLSHPSPGARIFSDPEARAPTSPSKRPAVVKTSDALGPRRTIAHRGVEVFTVVGNKIRWADLAEVKEQWENRNQKKADEASSEDQAYRTLKTNIYYQITSLSVSPSGHYLAISTEHTVHIAVLPDSSRLHDGDHSDIKLKVFQLGPTTHTIPESPLAAVLWHPLAASSSTTDCLVTVTVEAAVRLWELERTNHWSFERPALAIDLKKLADGTSSDQDFEPSGFGQSRGFSADAFDMEVASACWGGRAAEHEDPWAAMALWTSMTNGNVFALCPLLPSKWRPTPTTIPALTTSTIAKTATLDSDDIDSDERRAADQQFQWVLELDNEQYAAADPLDESIRLRPSDPSAIPRLQGPFELPLDDPDDEVEVSDIIVIPANLDEKDLFSGEDDYEILSGARSLPFNVVCLTTTDSIVYILLELDAISGQWLPNRGRGHFSVPTWDAGDLIHVDTIALNTEGDNTARPTFTIDPGNPYHFFVTAGNSVVSLSLESWASRVGFEVSDDGEAAVDAGLASRLKIACQGDICMQQNLISQQSQTSDRDQLVTAALIEHIDLGSILLTSSHNRAVAAQLDQHTLRTSKLGAQASSFSTSNTSPFRASQALMQAVQAEISSDLDPPPTRAPYAPSNTFYVDHIAPLDRLKASIPAHRRSVLTQQPLRLSPACLDIMTLAHRTFSQQTSAVEQAAAELFRRCERLREELADQVRQMAELAEKLGQLRLGAEDTDDDDEHEHERNPQTHSQKFDARIEAAKVRQKELFNRYEKVRQKAGQIGHKGQELSIKERAWVGEIKSLSERVGLEMLEKEQKDVISTRVSETKKLTERLLADVKDLKSSNHRDDNAPSTPDGKSRGRSGGQSSMSRFQREKMKEVMDMVEREALIIEAVQGRLGRLSVNT